RAIARMTGHDRKTIRKYIDAQQVPRYKPRARRPSKLDPFKPYLVARIREGMLNCNVLLEKIRAQGYGGGKIILNLLDLAGALDDGQLPGVLEPVHERPFREPHPPGRDHRPDRVQVLHDDLEALVLLPDPGGARTSTSSKITWLTGTPRTPIFCSFLPTVSPGVSRLTTKTLYPGPRGPSSWSWRP